MFFQPASINKRHPIAPRQNVLSELLRLPCVMGGGVLRRR